MDSSLFWSFALRASRLFRGATLHRGALLAAHAHDFMLAERLFESGAERYRRDMRVEPLARLRVHQEIVRLRALAPAERDPERCIEVERALARLDRIESLEPPFGLVDAETLLASWLKEDAAAAEHFEDIGLARAA